MLDKQLQEKQNELSTSQQNSKKSSKLEQEFKNRGHIEEMDKL